MTTTDPVAAELASTRKSVNDLVRAELNSLVGNSALSSADKLRLKQHFDCIREIENTMGTIGAMCTKTGLSSDVTGLTEHDGVQARRRHGRKIREDAHGDRRAGVRL